MVKKKRSTIAFPAVMALALLLPACGGGGGGGSTAPSTSGSVSPLTVVKKVSVVDAQTAETAQPAGVTALRFAVPTPLAVPTDPDSDYVNDIPNVYVEERSVDSFNMVNQILCMVAQTGYAAMINEGPYKAQIDLKTCEGRGSASSRRPADGRPGVGGEPAPVHDVDGGVVEVGRFVPPHRQGLGA